MYLKLFWYYSHNQLPLHIPLPRQTVVGMGTGELIASSEMEVMSALSMIGSVDIVHVGRNLGSVPEDGRVVVVEVA